jgi:N-acetylglutamate synthase-like GNAT family acetyltransferase
MMFRDAQLDDIPYIVSLLADDPLGAQREQLGDPAYAEALKAIDAEPSTRFIVVEEDGVVVGCMQLTIMPGLARRGARRAQLESVRIAGSQRRKGLGALLVAEGVRLAREAGCGMVQLSSDMSRKDAHRFWERQGFKASHVGMKLHL